LQTYHSENRYNGTDKERGNQVKARALEIAIKKGVVNPDVTGYVYLWEHIQCVAEGPDTPPRRISFGNTLVQTEVSDYTPEELQKAEAWWGDKMPDFFTQKAGKVMIL
jgi:hypothetical protein